MHNTEGGQVSISFPSSVSKSEGMKKRISQKLHFLVMGTVHPPNHQPHPCWNDLENNSLEDGFMPHAASLYLLCTCQKHLWVMWRGDRQTNRCERYNPADRTLDDLMTPCFLHFITYISFQFLKLPCYFPPQAFCKCCSVSVIYCCVTNHPKT